MEILVFDIEANSVVPEEVTEVHCLSIFSTKTKKLRRYVGRAEIEKGVHRLEQTDKYCGHHIIGYDLPVLKLMFDMQIEPKKIIDTVVLVKLLVPYIKLVMPIKGKWAGKPYSLGAMGVRLGTHKGDYDGGWDVYTDEMGDYCDQDVMTNYALLKWCIKHERFKHWTPEILRREHNIKILCEKVKNQGWYFDVKRGEQIRKELEEAIAPALKEAQRQMPIIISRGKRILPKKTKGEFTAEAPYTRLASVLRGNHRIENKEIGCDFCEVMFTPPNPSSPVQLRNWLLSNGWQPVRFTKADNPETGLEIIENLPENVFPNKHKILPYFTIKKRLEQLLGSKKSGYTTGFLTAVNDEGYLHGTVDPQGTYTGRCSHFSPNTAQVPRPQHNEEGVLFGRDGDWNADFRECFKPPPHMPYLMGIDQDALEARTIAHRVAPFDKGATIEMVLNGSKEEGTDIHSRNRDIMGLADRNLAKRILYAVGYGAGASKVALLLGSDMQTAYNVMNKLYEAMPGLKLANAALRAEFRKYGFIRLCGGRPIYPQKDHALIAAACQGDGAEICKLWKLIGYSLCIKEFTYGVDFAIVGDIHDEVQVACRTEEIAKRAAVLFKKASDITTKKLQYSIPLTTDDGQIGRSWLETH